MDLIVPLVCRVDHRNDVRTLQLLSKNEGFDVVDIGRLIRFCSVSNFFVTERLCTDL